MCPGKSSKPNTLDNPEKNKEKTRSKKQVIFRSAFTLNQQVPFPITWSIPRSHIRTPSCLSTLQSAPLYLLPTAARPLLRLCPWPHCSPASTSLCPGLCQPAGPPAGQTPATGETTNSPLWSLLLWFFSRVASPLRPWQPSHWCLLQSVGPTPSWSSLYQWDTTDWSFGFS